MIMIRLVLVSLALATTCLAQRSTWIVDQAMGPGAHHSTIHAALAQAVDGDRILVRQGTYPHFVVTRGVAIIAAPGVVIRNEFGPWPGPVEVRDVPAGRDVRISGLRFQGLPVLVRDCAGLVLFEGVTPDMWVTIQRCKQTFLTRCSMQNVYGVFLHESNVVISEGTPIESLELRKASNLALVNTSMTGLGGRRGPWGGWIPAPSVITIDATSKVTITGDSSALIQGGSTTHPLIAGSGSLVLDPRVQLKNYATSGAVIGPAIKLTKRVVPYLEAQGAPLGGTVKVTLKAAANQPFFLAVGLPGSVTAFPGLGGLVWLDLKTAILIANGSLDAKGVYGWSIPVPKDNALLGLALVWQGTAGPSLGQQWLSNPSAYMHGL